MTILESIGGEQGTNKGEGVWMEGEGGEDEWVRKKRE